MTYIVQPEDSGIIQVPRHLVRDEIEGIAFPYKGVEKVLSGELDAEDIIGCSTLQALLIAYLNKLLISKLSEDDYYVFTGEIGNHIGPKNNLSYDLSIWSNESLSTDQISNRYASVPPKMVVEVDVRVETKPFTEDGYLQFKTKKILDFGADKVIWILSAQEKVVIAEQGKEVRSLDWSETFDLFEGIKANIKAYLDRRGVSLK